ncbi:MAG: hypothetical protein HY831_05270 [Candidatus Aenigmarchaeota archaeon]|nr:hypothetical protein [Candidatus Aenigmarchaeota archaeon]
MFRKKAESFKERSKMMDLDENGWRDFIRGSNSQIQYDTNNETAREICEIMDSDAFYYAASKIVDRKIFLMI